MISFRYYLTLSALTMRLSFLTSLVTGHPKMTLPAYLAITTRVVRFLLSGFIFYSALSAFQAGNSLSALSAQNLFNTTPYSAVFCRSLHTDGKKWLSRQTFAYLATKLPINRLNENRQNLWENTSLNSDNRFSNIKKANFEQNNERS